MEDIEAYHALVEEVLKGDVRMISGCRDNQYSADLGTAGSACTNAVLGALDSGDVDTWAGLLMAMYTTLQETNPDQAPLLSTSRMFDLNDSFTVVNPSGNGNTRALLVGINYVGQSGELNACHTDVDNMKTYLADQGYSMDEADCRVLKDDGEHGNPDLQGIKDGIEWLVAGAAEGDSLFFHFSGHGGTFRDSSGDEMDGTDETLCPVDYQDVGSLTDDNIVQQLILPIPEGVTLTAVMDSCHSGSVFDLPYTCDVTAEVVAQIDAGEMELAVSPCQSFVTTADNLRARGAVELEEAEPEVEEEEGCQVEEVEEEG